MPQLPPGADRRRQPQPTDRHTLTIHHTADRLTVRCRCGATIGGNRTEDTRSISLHDLIRLTVLHSAQLGRGKR